MASTQNLLEEPGFQQAAEIRRRRDNAEKWEELRNFIYNPADGSIFKEDRTNWVYTVSYYTAFLIGLTVFFIISMAFFMIDLDDINPEVQAMESPLKQNPGLAVRPVPDFQTTLIRFQQGKPQTYKAYTDHIQAFLWQYENEQQVGENFIDCSNGRPPNTRNKVCRFNLDILGDGCVWQKDYGYDEGQPCILFKLNRIFDWEPEQYAPNEVPPHLVDRWRPDHIAVTCEGEFPQDLENIGNITYIPPWGIPTYFFPYLNQEGFRSPLMMVKFENPGNGVAISILCKIWVKNVSHDTNDQTGVIRFQLLVD